MLKKANKLRSVTSNKAKIERKIRKVKNLKDNQVETFYENYN